MCICVCVCVYNLSICHVLRNKRRKKEKEKAKIYAIYLFSDCSTAKSPSLKSGSPNLRVDAWVIDPFLPSSTSGVCAWVREDAEVEEGRIRGGRATEFSVLVEEMENLQLVLMQIFKLTVR